jgi:hypothetical protein
MDQSELKKHLSDYATKIKSGAASTADFSDIKNKIRASYDAGHLDKETMTDLGKAASHNFKNRFSSKGLLDLPNKIAEKGGMVGKLEEAAAPVMGKIFTSAKEAGKKVRSFGPLLGMLGAGAAAMGVGNKAMAGDLSGASIDAADLATDYIPGVSQAKMALQSNEAGKGSDEVQGKEAFDFTPYKTEKKSKFGGLKNKLAGIK